MSAVPFYRRAVASSVSNNMQSATIIQDNPSTGQDTTRKEQIHVPTPPKLNLCEIGATWFLKSKAVLKADINIDDSVPCFVNFCDTHIRRELNDYAYGHPVLPLWPLDREGSRYLVAIVTSFKNMPIERWRYERLQRGDCLLSIPILNHLPTPGDATAVSSSAPPSNASEVNNLYLARGWYDKPTYVRIDRLLDVPRAYMKLFLHDRASNQPPRLSFESYQALIAILGLEFDAHKLTAAPVTTLSPPLPSQSAPASSPSQPAPPTLSAIDPPSTDDPASVEPTNIGDSAHATDCLVEQLGPIKIGEAGDKSVPAAAMGNESAIIEEHPTNEHSHTIPSSEQTTEETISPQQITLSSMQDPLVLGIPHEEFGDGIQRGSIADLKSGNFLKEVQSASSMTDSESAASHFFKIPMPIVEKQHTKTSPTQAKFELSSRSRSKPLDTPEIEKILAEVITRAASGDPGLSCCKDLSPNSAEPAENANEKHVAEIEVIPATSLKPAGEARLPQNTRRRRCIALATVTSTSRRHYRGEKRSSGYDLTAENSDETPRKKQKTKLGASFVRINRFLCKNSKHLALRMRSRLP
ncbi:uncharacterized protein PAC_08694 [Phialocephala subalpina]|uniref:Uncharacterized protein n=1 Tax=Phialocephala subalpina TaxID=576137 RepID=A0A1L7X1B0_9HELO|nr:uncharacterized protein PAC_08694 [Phialocephala subalpina]